MAAVPFLVLPVFAVFAPSGATAQVVVGQVVEEGSGTPVDGAFVTLLTEDDRQLDSGLAGEQGTFRLRTPGPGRYRIRAERIGYESITSDVLDISIDGLQITIRVPADPVSFGEVRVEGRGRGERCTLRPEEGQATYRLWEEARKALTIAEWTSDEQRVLYEVALFDRSVDPTTLVVGSEEVQLLGVVNEQPFVTTPSDTLLQEGFVRVRDGRVVFDAIDAATLLTDRFLGSHCFRRIPGGTALAGLTFEPVDPRGRRTDIRGTLWVDRTTAELRFLEFFYVNPPRHLRRVNPELYGGRVDFRRLADGSWITSRWIIRSPVLSGAGFRARLQAFSEFEGEIIGLVNRQGERLPWSRNAARLTGQVVHPRWGDPIPLATIRLVGAPYQVQADENGYFGIDGLPGGRYRIEAAHPSLPGGSIDRVVELSRGATTQIDLGG